ncbi:hypothetical protein DMB44_05330 [Thermoplasma sp. Kam2015]|uniref:MvaI/BcnI family restriction endonuclease n=1 Tax=Thermoplasma sp. Kam2015 TaxID=2094122 RepID=UPI000D9B7A3D|nr:MvaI/BcnI family restriction endonuclease [Thermoplasma sp. Kam2015]PYB68143.1 hypothetical protein DMB44_05330 [Thermoplasma sp. Kam2015]
MDLNEFKIRFRQIQSKGYVKSLREGPTGIGMTLETLLGIHENNISLPDIDGIELKAHREDSNNMITLFTFNRGAWVMDPLEAIKKYGTPDSNGRLGLYFTMSFRPNNAGLFLYADDQYVMVRHIDGSTIVRWRFDDLQNQFEQKIPAIIIVYARVEERIDGEYFNFYKAILYKGANKDIIRDSILNGIILIDLRLHYAGTMARNHGTGFRVHPTDLPKVFASAEVL